MTEEQKNFRDVLIKLLFVIAFAVLYSLGGADFGPGKWIRRFVAPFVLVTGMTIYSRDWKTIFQFPLMIGPLCLGYGSDVLWIKILKRALYGLLNGAASSFNDLINKRFLIAIFQSVLVLSSVTILGVWNPLPNARVEEFVIAFLIAFFPIMSSRVKTK